jgi:aminocarboxymuconate-semialdehyde decarboxylase
LKTINVHAHVVPDGLYGKAGSWGPELIDHGDSVVFKVGMYEALRLKAEASAPRKETVPGPAGRIQAMDATGWDVHVITPTVLFFLYNAEPEIGVPFTRLHNDKLAEFCAPYPDRLFFQATLPLQDRDASVREIDRVVGLGAKGIYVGATNLAGHELDDEYFDPIWAKLVDYQLPLMIHACPTAVTDGGGDAYLMSSFVGTVAEETKAFCYLVFGGVFDRFPGLRVYISHGGGFVPYQIGRFEAGSKVMSDGKNKKPMRSYLENFYFDFLLPDRMSRNVVLDTVPIDHILTGDNFGGADGVDAIGLLNELDLSQADREKVLYTNAKRLYNLPV